MTTRIDLTNEEIEVIMISLMTNKITLEENIERLERHNMTGVNSKKIALKKERIADCVNLFDKLYEAQKKL